ncbi:MAG: hypothetical protein JWO88_375 [Frankiales bacterium]|nr:hypothetical protein [Frankiales bacterium]
MSIVRIETIPQTWTESDTAFFTIVARVFSPDFTYGASVMLAAATATDTSQTVTVASLPSAHVMTASVADVQRALVPVVVRRPR